MDGAMLWLTLVLAVAAVASAVFAYVQAHAATRSREDAEIARNESRSARDEAVLLSREANAAFERQAKAQEDLVRAATPKNVPEFSLRPAGANRWMATNTGKAVAFEAKVTRIAGIVHVDDSDPRDVHMGDSLFFTSLNAAGENPRIRIQYVHRPQDADEVVFSNDVTLP